MTGAQEMGAAVLGKAADRGRWKIVNAAAGIRKHTNRIGWLAFTCETLEPPRPGRSRRAKPRDGAGKPRYIRPTGASKDD